MSDALADLRLTDLVTHEIHMDPLCQPVKRRQRRFSKGELDFALERFPEMVRAGIIEPGQVPWVAETLFPKKPSASDPRRD